MRAIAVAAFLALSSCSAAPAFAQEAPTCVSVDGVLEQIEGVKQYGARVVTFARDDAAKVLDLMGAPEGTKADAIIMVVGDRAAVLLLVEGDKVCRNVAIPLKAAQMLEQVIRGRSV